LDNLGIAVIGCGMMAQNLHLPNIERHPELDLGWCCDIDEDTLREVEHRFHPTRVTTDASDVAADPSCRAVLLSTTHTVRLPLIELFARAGKHIYIEKPIADTFDEMKKILSVVRETGVKTQVGHNRRAAPAVRHALRVLEKHRANPISPKWRWNREGADRPTLPGEHATMVLLRVNDDYWSWKKWAFAHGALINEMTHFADLACCFIPSAPVRVTTTGDRLANHVVTIEYADGSLAAIFATAFGSFGYPKELVEVYHNGAAIVIDHLMEVRVAGIIDEPFRTVFPVASDRHSPSSQDGVRLASARSPERRDGHPPSSQEGVRGRSTLQGIEGYYRRVVAVQHDAIASGDNSILPEQPDKGHYVLLDDWVQCVKHGGEPVCRVEVAAVPTAIILRALESERSHGQPVSVVPEDYCLSVHG